MDFSSRKYLEKDSANSYRISTFNKGNIIFKKGETGDLMYEVLSGSVGIYLHYKEEGEKLLVVKQAGDFFGEIALIETRPRTATAVSMEDETKLREVSRHGFIFYVKRRPEILKPITDAMADRFKMQRKQYRHACSVLKKYDELVRQGKLPTEEFADEIDKLIADARDY